MKGKKSFKQEKFTPLPEFREEFYRTKELYFPGTDDNPNKGMADFVNMCCWHFLKSTKAKKDIVFRKFTRQEEDF